MFCSGKLKQFGYTTMAPKIKSKAMNTHKTMENQSLTDFWQDCS